MEKFVNGTAVVEGPREEKVRQCNSVCDDTEQLAEGRDRREEVGVDSLGEHTSKQNKTKQNA